MVIWLALLFPVVSIILMYVIPQFRGKIALWEPLVIIAASAVIILIVKFSSETYQTTDTERYIDYVIKTEYHEYWNEWITKTCEDCTTDSKGSTHCHTYDCSYREEHKPYTKIYTSSGNTYTFDEGYDIGGMFSDNKGNPVKFNSLAKQFGNKITTERAHFNELDKNYGENYDGDIHTVLYNPEVSKIEYCTWEHTYENRVQASNSIQKFDPVDTSEVNFYGLYDYPKIDGYKSKCILGGMAQFDEYANRQNALIGPTKQLKTYFLIFKNKPRKAGMIQEKYWGGGNKNEAVICLGIDNSNNITWSYVFSWSPVFNFKVDIRNYIEGRKILNDSTFKDIIDYSYNNLNKNFKRKHFKEFSYLTVEPSTGAIITTFILVFLACLGIFIWAVKNDFDADMTNNKYKNYRY